MAHNVIPPIETPGARGLLIIGDIHLSSVKPSRRREGYSDSVLGKLSDCLTIARREKLVPVLLGDIYHRPVEPDESLKARLTELLASSWITPLCNVGNHDKAGERLQRCDSLWTLHAANMLRIVMNSGPAALIRVEDEGASAVIGIGMTPYGQTIPQKVSEELRAAADGVIWFTHHDLAFKGTYMKTEPLKEIEGCGIAVNGHMHHNKPFEERGGTTWCNFGSLTRTSVDEATHSPCAMAFLPLQEESFVCWPIGHEEDAFDLSASLAPVLPRRVGEEAEGFAQMLVDELASAAARSDSGEILKDELLAFLDEGRRPAAREPLLSLLSRAAEAGK